MRSRLASLSSGQRAWIALWMSWGTTIAALIAVIDGVSPIAVPWLLAGIGIAALACAPHERILAEVWAWYDRCANNWDRSEPEDLTTPAFAARLDEWRARTADLTDLDSEEREVLVHHLAQELSPSMLGGLLPMPPFVGLIWGTFFGPFIGILAKFDPRYEMSAAYGATVWLAGIIVLFTLAATIIFTLMVPGRDVPMRLRWRILLAPILMIGCLAHCVRHCWPQRPTIATSE